MTSQDIFSKIQLAIGDITFNKIQREEYLQYLEETMGQIAVYASYYLDTPPIFKPVKDSHIIEINYLDGSEPIALNYVTRGKLECREFSNQTMFAAANDPLHRGFHVNDTSINKQAFTSKIIPPVNNETTSKLLLYFPIPFEADEEVEVIVAITANGTTLPSKFNDPKHIPLYAFDAIYHGVLTKVLQSLMVRNLSKHGNNWQTVEMIYNRKLRDLKSYIVRLKSKNSYPEIQPLKWLSDTGHRIQSGSGIPSEWSKTIINETDRWI